MIFLNYADRAATRRDDHLRRLASIIGGNETVESWGAFLIARAFYETAWVGPPGLVVLGRAAVIDRRAGRALNVADLAESLLNRGESRLASLASPFRLAWSRAESHELSVAADHMGLAHVYGWEEDGVACVSTSSALIGRMFGLEPDKAAITGFALIGAFVGQDTAITGVRKLRPGHFFQLSDGRLTETPMTAPTALIEGRSDAETLRLAVMRQSEAIPDAAIEIGGGHDSRLILAGIAPDARRHHRGFTIGAEGDPDIVIARQICALSGMEHELVDPLT